VDNGLAACNLKWMAKKDANNCCQWFDDCSSKLTDEKIALCAMDMLKEHVSMILV
jgi:hypothetical protein